MTDNFRLTFLYSDEGRAIYEEGYRVGYELGKGDVQKVADESYDLGYERGKLHYTQKSYSDKAIELARRVKEKALKNMEEVKYDDKA